jgi:hypothetical protein
MVVQDIISQTAARYGIDPAAMLRIAQLESGLRPDARNPNSSAAGLFQFINSTWKQYGQGDPLDPSANADAAGRYLTDVSRHLQSSLGRAPTPWELYLGHQQGMGGATALLRSPDKRAVDALTAIYGSPVAARRAIALNLPSGSNLHPDTVTAGQFASLWQSRFNRTAPAGFALPESSKGRSMALGAPTDPDMGEEVPLDPVEVGVSIARRMEEDSRVEPRCPPGTYFDPIMNACVPVPEDDKRFQLASQAPEAAERSPVDRFESIFAGLPSDARLLP